MKSISSILTLVALVTPSLAQTIDLGTAATFALLAVKGVNNTGPSFVKGDVGTTGHDIQGFPPGVLVGTQETQNAAAAQAQADFLSARDAVRAMTGGEEFGEFETISGETFTPGVFTFEKEIQVVGDITLSGAGEFFFISGSHLILSNDVTVHLADGAVATSVFWAPGDATIIGNNSVLPGFVLTDDRVQLNDSAVINGQLYAESGIAITNSIVGFQ